MQHLGVQKVTFRPTGGDFGATEDELAVALVLTSGFALGITGVETGAAEDEPALRPLGGLHLGIALRDVDTKTPESIGSPNSKKFPA